MIFKCPKCDQQLSVDSSAAGKNVKCPKCQHIFNAPVSADCSQPAPSESIYCPKCGHQNNSNNFKCTNCGFILHGPAAPQYIVTDNSLGGLIPYKNQLALWAYYLGVFSLIPCAGIPLGIAALILGIKGLKYSDLHPEAKGRAHAWTGVILGGLCAAGYTLLILLPFIIALTAKR